MSTVKGSSLPLTTLFRYVYRNSLEELEQVITVDDFMQGITKKRDKTLYLLCYMLAILSYVIG